MPGLPGGISRFGTDVFSGIMEKHGFRLTNDAGLHLRNLGSSKKNFTRSITPAMICPSNPGIIAEVAHILKLHV
ncbi:MAG: hypothetical protein EOP14_05260 [Pseudomonas sp.]|nr:MAG: hypothetical protein EOP14_05260 [Pseudomonas sp.]